MIRSGLELGLGLPPHSFCVEGLREHRPRVLNAFDEGYNAGQQELQTDRQTDRHTYIIDHSP